MRADTSMDSTDASSTITYFKELYVHVKKLKTSLETTSYHSLLNKKHTVVI